MQAFCVAQDTKILIAYVPAAIKSKSSNNTQTVHSIEDTCASAVNQLQPQINNFVYHATQH
jgi:hypothetical protein